MYGEQTAAVIAADRQYMLQNYARPELVIERGEGVYLYDTEGRRYLDFVSGIAVNALGYADQGVQRVIAEQAGRLIHISNLVHNAPGTALARRLVENAPGLDRSFFCNSGAEAIEASLKFARRYARKHYGEHKTAFVAFDQSFHGRTMGALAVTYKEAYRAPFMPVMPGGRHAEFNNLDSLTAAMGDDVCAVLIEPIQGEGGLRAATPEFLAHARELCDRYGALLIFDEIQCGVGRTGSLWAYEQYGVTPDMMTVAKPLAGGLPIGGVVMRQSVADAIQAGDHGTTFGGGPLVTAVADHVLARISDPQFLAHVREVGDYLDESLQDLAAEHSGRIRELRGRGLMRGIVLDGPAAAVKNAAQKHGLIVTTAGEDVLRLLPPLIITQAHVDEALTGLRAALR
jgi:predicted acetylornithine/succinylornithine family transaminase